MPIILLYYNRLLDVLADRKAKKGLSGHVLINGRRQSRNFKCASAYVVQVSTYVLVGVYVCMHVSTYMHTYICAVYTCVHMYVYVFGYGW